MFGATEIGNDEGYALPLGDRRRHERDRGLVGAEHGGDVVLGDQAQRLLLADLRIALMIGFVEFDLGAAKIGQACRRSERQGLELGIGGVDDVGA